MKKAVSITVIFLVPILMISLYKIFFPKYLVLEPTESVIFFPMGSDPLPLSRSQANTIIEIATSTEINFSNSTRFRTGGFLGYFQIGDEKFEWMGSHLYYVSNEREETFYYPKFDERLEKLWGIFNLELGRSRDLSTKSWNYIFSEWTVE